MQIDLLIFFYCYAANRDLHSFPTRRSSDLPARVRGPSLDPRRAGGAHRLQRVSHRRGSVPLDEPRRSLSRDDRREVHVGREDRKSTRLNSSHMSISYAVFCLKKKTITQHPT